MPKRILSRLSESSPFTRGALLSIVAFIIIFGIQWLCHLVPMGWPREPLAADIVESLIIGAVVVYLVRVREERLLRRYNQIRYLNHHVRNCLHILSLLEQQMAKDEAFAVRGVVTRIRTVLEQISRDEEVQIDERTPEKPFPFV